MDKRVRLVVVNENTLGYVIPDTLNVGILHTSILRGSHFDKWGIIGAYSFARLATKKDFEDYRVSFEGFEDKTKFVYAEDQLIS